MSLGGQQKQFTQQAQQSTTATELPSWFTAQQHELFDNYKTAALDIGPDAFYPGQRTASQNRFTGQGQAAAEAIPGMLSGYGDAASAYKNILSGGSNITPGQIATTDLTPYLNPYTKEVEGNALRALNESGATALNNNSAMAKSAGAFGGSRASILDAVTNSEIAKKGGDLSASLRSAGFDRATSLAGQDIATRLAADTTNASNRLGAAQGLTANTSANVAGGINAAQTLLGVGQQQQNYDQSLIDASMKQFYEGRDRTMSGFQGLFGTMASMPLNSIVRQDGQGASSTTKTSSPDIGSIIGGLFNIGKGIAGMI